MCGICGYVGPPDRETLKAMCDALVHRGPDAEGFYQDQCVSLGHRRLSIVDLNTGQQPLISPDGSLVLVFNGEIYNHPQLRSQFMAEGVEYRTTSDTESILHAYSRYGTDCVRHLDGMFAFVLYDRQRNVLFGARDRFGKKPLYYTMPDGVDVGPEVSTCGFTFASELKSLRKHPQLRAGLRIDHRALRDYLLNDYVVGTSSIFEGIRRLAAGHAFEYGLPGSAKPGFRTWRYWDIDISTQHEPTWNVAAEEVINLLGQAVERRLMADVPLGAFLSGGIDSSAIVALLTRYRPPKQIKTFSIAFDEASFDESAYAQQVADHFGTTHRVKRFSAGSMLESIPCVIAMLDEPFADPSILPVSMLSAFAREHVTVALGGDGGDELFAGYDPFRAIGPARWYRKQIPGWVHRNVVMRMLRWLPSSTRNMSLEFRAKRFLRAIPEDVRVTLPIWMGAFHPQMLRRIAPGLEYVLDDPFQEQMQAAERVLNANGDEYQVALDFFERFYLCDDILVKVDRASMMHSLEVRAPFLDSELAAYVNGLPTRFKISPRGRTKRILKYALAGRGRKPIVPWSIVHRPKKGFGIPVAHWIRHELTDEFRQVLHDPWPGELDVFDRSQIEELLDRHIAGQENNYKELWALYMLSRWAREHLE